MCVRESSILVSAIRTLCSVALSNWQSKQTHQPFCSPLTHTENRTPSERRHNAFPGETRESKYPINNKDCLRPKSTLSDQKRWKCFALQFYSKRLNNCMTHFESISFRLRSPSVVCFLGETVSVFGLGVDAGLQGERVSSVGENYSFGSPNRLRVGRTMQLIETRSIRKRSFAAHCLTDSSRPNSERPLDRQRKTAAHT